MARAKPIVASKLPCHLDVLNKENCKFYYPDDPKDLAKSILYIYENPGRCTFNFFECLGGFRNSTYEMRAKNLQKLYSKFRKKIITGYSLLKSFFEYLTSHFSKNCSSPAEFHTQIIYNF